ncbi:double homeobox protein 4-like protein 4, partial [Rattus norvegicus]|uniref:double homeobox protein 4-like protein 4 n=1 Tax=Rattus norvegicus TaxID=10116 RepID=UPI002FD830ED
GSNVDSSCVLRESRRRKTVWQAWQKKALLSAFCKNQYPSFWDRQELARQIQLPASRIRVWFQNQRSRTGVARHGPKRSSRGSIPLASQQLEEGFGSRSQGSSMPSDSRRPRTRLNLQQRRILVQAFERNPLPGFATREQLGQRTGLNEDTIHIWFQNRRARQARAPDQDVPASQVQDVATGGLSGKDEAAPDNLLLMAAAGGVGMENSSSSDQPHFHEESQHPQVALPEGRGQSQTATQAYEPGTLELLLDELLEEDQVECDRPFPVDLDGNPGSQQPQVAQPEGQGQEQALTQGCNTGPLELFLDQLLMEVRVETHKKTKGYMLSSANTGSSSPSEFLLLLRESQLPQWAQPEGQGQEQALTQGCNTGPLELFLDQLLMEVRVETHSPGPVHLEGGGQQMDATPELPLSQEEYEALLDIL